MSRKTIPVDNVQTLRRTNDICDIKVDLKTENRIPQHSSDSETIYSLLRPSAEERKSLLFDFTSSYPARMDLHAENIMIEAGTLGIDHEYFEPILRSSKNMIARLWNIPWEVNQSLVSPEFNADAAALKALYAHLHRWRHSTGRDNGNFLISAAHDQVWDRIAELTGSQMRVVPLSYDMSTKWYLAPELIDENTFLAVAAVNSSVTGINDNIDYLSNLLDCCMEADVPIHIDASCGGFLLPFLVPDFKWDFRVERVMSISAAAECYGMVYPTLGWLALREGTMPGNELIPENSASSALIASFYYQLHRLGWSGYSHICRECIEAADFLVSILSAIEQIEVLNSTHQTPTVLFTARNKPGKGWNILNLHQSLLNRGIKTTPLDLKLPDGVKQVLKIVIRPQTSFDTISLLGEEIRQIVADFCRLESEQ